MERNTAQKQIFRTVFESAKSPMTAQDAWMAAQKIKASVGIATAYRIIKEFASQGYLREVHLPGDAVYYERADLPHHHFFQCRQCDHVYEIACCHPALRSLIPDGFQAEGHELIFYGRCAPCLAV